MEADNQPWENGTVDSLQLAVDEVMLSTALAEVNLCGELDEEDWAVAKSVAARNKFSFNFNPYKD